MLFSSLDALNSLLTSEDNCRRGSGRSGVSCRLVFQKLICIQFGNMSPLKRIGTAEEVAGLVSYLISPEAAFITGNFLLFF